MSSCTDDQEAVQTGFDKDGENSQDSAAELQEQVKEEPEDATYEQASAASIPSDHTSLTDSRNSSPLPAIQFENSSPAHRSDSSPVPVSLSGPAQSSPQVPLNDLFAGSTIRSQLQGAIASRKMDAVQNIVESLLKKNETLLAMSDAKEFRPNIRRSRAAHDGFVRRSEPAFPTAGQGAAFPVSHSMKAHLNASKKTADVFKQRLIRPRSPTRKYDGLLKDKTHFSYALMESNANDHEIEEILNVQNHEIVCAIGSKSFVTDSSHKVVASLEFGYFWCNFCPFSSNNKMLLIQHVLEHRFCCKYCAYESFCRSDILRHMYRKHQDFTETASRVSYCTLLSDYIRVKARVEGKENKDPDDDVAELDPEEMAATLERESGKKRKANDEDEASTSVNKSSKIDESGNQVSSPSISHKERTGKSRKSLNPKRHPPPKESDYDIFDMEVEEICEPQPQGTLDDTEPEKVLYSSLASPNQYGEGYEKQMFPSGTPRIISALPVTKMQTLTSAAMPNSYMARPALSSSSSHRRTYNKNRSNSSSSSLYWSCGYCTFQSNGQAEIKDHSNQEHPGKPHRYVALIRNMTPDSIINKSVRGSQNKVSSSRKLSSGSNTSSRSAGQSPQLIHSLSGVSFSSQAANHTKTNGEDDVEPEDIVSLREKEDSSTLLKVKFHPLRSSKKDTTVYKCYHCSYTAKRHSSMKSHIYYKHRGKSLIAVDEDPNSGQQIFFCARDDCTFKSENANSYLHHVDQCTPWNKPELADVEVEPHIRECLEQTIHFAEMAQEKDSGRRRLREKSSCDCRCSCPSGPKSSVNQQEEEADASDQHVVTTADQNMLLVETNPCQEELPSPGRSPPHTEIQTLSPEGDQDGPHETCQCDCCDVCQSYDVCMDKCLHDSLDSDIHMGESPFCSSVIQSPKNVNGCMCVESQRSMKHEDSQCDISERCVPSRTESPADESVVEENIAEFDKCSVVSQSVSSEDNFIPVGIVDIVPQNIVINDDDIQDSNMPSDITIKSEVPESPGQPAEKLKCCSPSVETVVSEVEFESEIVAEADIPFTGDHYMEKLSDLSLSNIKEGKEKNGGKENSRSPDVDVENKSRVGSQNRTIDPHSEPPTDRSQELQRDRLEPQSSSSSLKLKFKTVGQTTVCRMCSPLASSLDETRGKEKDEEMNSSSSCSETSGDEQEGNETSSMNEDTGHTGETERDPKWLKELLDSSIDSDSEGPASNVFNTGEPHGEVYKPASCGVKMESPAVVVVTESEPFKTTSCASPIEALASSQSTCTHLSENKPCYSFVPARSAAVKALSKMKPTCESEKSYTDEDSGDDFRCQKASCRNKISSSKSNCVTRLKSETAHLWRLSNTSHPKSVTSQTLRLGSDTGHKKSHGLYTCKYCCYDGGPLRKLKAHVLSKHRSMPAVVVDKYAQQLRRKSSLYFCPRLSCCELFSSEKNLKSHKLSHQNVGMQMKQKGCTTLNSLNSSENCSLILDVDKVKDSSHKILTIDKIGSLTDNMGKVTDSPQKILDKFCKLPSCRVELDMLDISKLSSEKSVPVKEEGKYACLYCTENHFDSSLAGMKTHYATEHEGQLMVMRDTEARKAQQPSRIYVCDYPGCNSYYISRGELDSHARNHKANFTYMYECACCGWYSASHSAASNHLKSEHADQNVSLIHMQVTIDEQGQTSRKVL